MCLLASWLECFLILPSHLADFVKPPKKQKMPWHGYLKIIYKKVLNIATNSPWIVLVLFFGIFIFSGFIAYKTNFELFPQDDARVAFVQIRGKTGTPLEKNRFGSKKN